jgi:hypothetical protein
MLSSTGQILASLSTSGKLHLDWLWRLKFLAVLHDLHAAVRLSDGEHGQAISDMGCVQGLPTSLMLSVEDAQAAQEGSALL